VMKTNESILQFATIMVFSVLLSSCAIYHHYGPYYGKVVDAETKQPLEGAAVLAVYYTQSYGLAGSTDNYLDAQETVTEKNGEFKIPSLNSFAFRPLQSFEPYSWFNIFKPGYGCYPNHKRVKPMFLPNGSLPANESVIIELPELRTKKERLENVMCEPVLIPNIKYNQFLTIINKERQYLNLEQIPIK
jgi:hypothetical protein